MHFIESRGKLKFIVWVENFLKNLTIVKALSNIAQEVKFSLLFLACNSSPVVSRVEIFKSWNVEMFQEDDEKIAFHVNACILFE